MNEKNMYKEMTQVLWNAGKEVAEILQTAKSLAAIKAFNILCSQKQDAEYTSIFNAITDVIRILESEQSSVSIQACEILKKAQQDCEEMYLQAEE